jgi:hypothetical protein
VDWLSTPLVECFERGDVPRDVRLVAAMGGLALPVPEQIAILILLVSDPDATIAARARRTIARLPAGTLASFLGNPDVPERVRDFFAAHPEAAADQTTDGEPVEADDADGEAGTEAGTEAGAGEASDGESDEALALAIGDGSSAAADQSVAHVGALRRLSKMNVAERIKAAMQGSREERSILIRDPNRVVAAAVLSSPKLSESDVEAIARMTNVSDEVLRQIGTSRMWAKSYTVVAALARNAKTPVGVSLALLPRLSERDMRILATDRNVPEAVRLSARKLNLRNTSRRQ